MAGVKNENERNQKIVKEWKDGKTAFSLARHYDLTLARVQQLVGRVLMREFREAQEMVTPKEEIPPVTVKRPKPRKKEKTELISGRPSQDGPLFSIDPE